VICGLTLQTTNARSGDVTMVCLTQKYGGEEAACKGGGTGAGRQMSFALLSAVSDAATANRPCPDTVRERFAEVGGASLIPAHHVQCMNPATQKRGRGTARSMSV
jgi:hypothetical protein